MTWSQKFFCVTRTVEVLLLSAKIDLAVGDDCDCQTKVNAVRSVVDSKSKSSQQPLDKLSPSSPLPVTQDLWTTNYEADNILSEPIRSNRMLAKLQPASQLRSSPLLSRCSSDNSIADFNQYKGHSSECVCSWCSNVQLLRIRAEFLMINHQLAGTPLLTGKTFNRKYLIFLIRPERKSDFVWQ